MRTIVRPEKPGDHAAIDEVNRLAFGRDDEARLVAAVRCAEGFDPALSLVAVRRGQVVGHILFSPIHIDTGRGNVAALALAPMAVRPDCQKRRAYPPCHLLLVYRDELSSPNRRPMRGCPRMALDPSTPRLYTLLSRVLVLLEYWPNLDCPAGGTEMNQDDLERVRSDLSMMKQAAGMGLPVGRADVSLSLGWAAAGIPLAAWAACTPVERATFALLLGIPVVGMLALSAVVARKCHRHRAKLPVRWREHRFQWMAAGVLVPLFGGFMIWGVFKGLSAEAVTVTALFMAGLGMLVPAMLDRARLFYLGWAISTMLFAVTAPMLGYRYLGVGVGGWLVVSGVLAAGIMGWQLRRSVHEHATD